MTDTTHKIYINRAHVFNEGVTWTTIAGLYPHAYVPEDALTAIQAERDAWKARAEAAEENVGILRASREALEAQVAQLQRELAKARSLGPGTKAEARAALKGNNNDRL